MSGIGRGIYLAADTPRSFLPLALEDGGGDKKLLAEALEGILTEDELEELAEQIRSIRIKSFHSDNEPER